MFCTPKLYVSQCKTYGFARESIGAVLQNRIDDSPQAVFCFQND